MFYIKLLVEGLKLKIDKKYFMKQKRPEWLPSSVNIEWYNKGIITEDIIVKTKAELNKIGIHSFKPEPKQIFRHFDINPNNVTWVVVNSIPWVGYKESKYEDLSSTQKTIYDKLEQEYGWEKAEYYVQNDLSDWHNCMFVNTSLTNVRGDIWKPLMTNLFEWFSSNSNYYCFIFLDNKSSEWAKYVKKHQVFYGFEPKEIQEFLTKQWGYPFIWGLPF